MQYHFPEIYYEAHCKGEAQGDAIYTLVKNFFRVNLQ